eukprot:TRINITY_DN10886_c3_g1_i1.p1 TRINITY_DN10886_c3_g1~~TRINITY_DN10886_c3_g1_i1.p1  ORF type:complete len:1069 (+),score=178.20 TRINITY_DN10886_c3_g1_i1:217-3207(+)
MAASGQGPGNEWSHTALFVITTTTTTTRTSKTATSTTRSTVTVTSSTSSTVTWTSSTSSTVTWTSTTTSSANTSNQVETTVTSTSSLWGTLASSNNGGQNTSANTSNQVTTTVTSTSSLVVDVTSTSSTLGALASSNNGGQNTSANTSNQVTTTSTSTSRTETSTTATFTTRTATVAVTEEARSQAAEAAVDAIAEAEQSSAKDLLAVAAKMDLSTLKAPLVKETVSASGAKVSVAVMTPAMAIASSGTISLKAPDSITEVKVPLAVLNQVSSLTGGPVALSSSSVPAHLSAALAAKGGDSAGAGGTSVPTLSAPPLSITLFDKNGKPLKLKLKEPMLLTMEGDTGSNVSCGFWDEDNDAWSNTGVSRVANPGGPLVCATTHLTIFAALIGAFLSALICSNAMGIFSIEGAKMIAKDPNWYKQDAAIALWSGIGLLALSLMVALFADARLKVRVNWRKDQLSILKSMYQNQQRVRAAEEAEEEQRQKEAEAQEDRELTRKERFNLWLASLGDYAWETVLWVVQILSWTFTQKYDALMFFLENLPQAPDKIVASCTDQVESLKTRIHSDTLELAKISSEKEKAKALEGPKSFVVEKMVTPMQNAAAHLATICNLAENGNAACEAFLNASFPLRIVMLFPAVHPWAFALFVSMFVSHTARVGLIAVKVLGSVAGSAIFFSASGGTLSRSTDPKCIKETDPFLKIVQSLTVGLSCALIADGVIAFLGAIRAHTFSDLPDDDDETLLAQISWWSLRVRFFWVLLLSFLLICIYVVCAFLANVTDQDGDTWVRSALFSLLEETILLPIGIAAGMAMIASLLLTIRPSIKEKVMSRFRDPEEAEVSPKLRSLAAAKFQNDSSTPIFRLSWPEKQDHMKGLRRFQTAVDELSVEMDSQKGRVMDVSSARDIARLLPGQTGYLGLSLTSAPQSFLQTVQTESSSTLLPGQTGLLDLSSASAPQSFLQTVQTASSSTLVGFQGAFSEPHEPVTGPEAATSDNTLT